MKTIRASKAEDFGEILNYVHDQFFQLKDVKFDREAEFFSIPINVLSQNKTKQKSFYFVQFWKYPIYQSQLVFHGVTEYTIKDEAETGEADINTIFQEENHLVIKCGNTVEVRLKVKCIDIALEFSKKIVGEKFGMALGFSNT